jgi:two-component system, cell cycle sensor histidine kinase and response regulator CckA
MSASVYIVEDERIVAEDIRMTLESCGYTVAGIAASRDQAIDGIGRSSPDLVLMDIILKGHGDGVETGRLVREQFDIPVIYLTAHADQGTLHRAKVSEPFGYIIKPFEARDLYSGIEMALYRHRLEKRIGENERWLASILHSVADGVIATDAMGMVKLVNPAAERIAGWGRSDVVGRDLSEIYRVYDGSSDVLVEVPCLSILIEQIGQRIEPQLRRLVRMDGSMVLVEQTVSPISDESKTVSGSLIVFRELPDSDRLPGQEGAGPT